MNKACLAFILLFAPACASDAESLRGSISDSYSLDHDIVRIRKQEDFLEVSFLRRSVDGFEAPAKLAARVADLPAGPLTIRGAAFEERVSLRRVAFEGPSRFPEIEGGALELDEFTFSDGASISGEFRVAFVDGRALIGEFSGTLAEVSVPTEESSSSQ